MERGRREVVVMVEEGSKTAIVVAVSVSWNSDEAAKGRIE